MLLQFSIFINYDLFISLHNCFNVLVCPSFCPVLSDLTAPALVLRNVANKSYLVCVKSEKYASWVTLRAQLDCCRQGEAEVRIIKFKTTWSEFQMPSQTALAEAKPRCVYSILKPHGQSFITSPELVQISCVQQVLPIMIYFPTDSS